MSALRVAELSRAFVHYYGPELPDYDAGRDSAFIMANHLAGLAREPYGRIAEWLTRTAPWMPVHEAEALADAAIAKPIRWRADTLAKRLGLTAAVRHELGIKTIGAIDKTKAEREAERKKRSRQRKASKRLAAGASPRQRAARRTRPWAALGMSRATWYRKGQPLAA